MLAHKKQRLEAELLQAALSCRGILSVVDAIWDLLCAVLPYRPFRIKPNNHELGEIFVQTLATGRLDDRRYTPISKWCGAACLSFPFWVRCDILALTIFEGGVIK